jgi:hypothetical protein
VAQQTFWKEQKERHGNWTNSNSIGTNDDRGVVGIRLREMSDLRREGLWVSVLGAICELCFFVTQGFMNSKSWGMFGTMRQRNSRDVAAA